VTKDRAPLPTYPAGEANSEGARDLAPLRISAVADPAGLDRFIRVPFRVFASDPAWVPPLVLERRIHLSPKHNPYFQHARWQAFVATRGDTPVGRISAQVDTLHLERYGDATGFFGMLDAEDQPETFAALIKTAEQWLREQGMRRVRGPFSLSINEETGLLIEGFETPPVFMMGHARPYYAAHVEALGYRKAVDTFAYMIASDFAPSPVMARLVAAAGKRVNVRPLDRKRFAEEIALLRDIFNDAWSENWGFLPFTAEEFRELGNNLRFLVDPGLIRIAEVDGEAAAFMVVIPNINEAIRDLGGRLAPLGWAKLLWRLKVRYPTTARVPLRGVRRKYQRTRLGPALAFLVIAAAQDRTIALGVKEVELSWILEDNAGMRSIIESIGGHAYKRYRIYERQLDA
jgi:GNAT superfamily N-acetyltransferase